MTSLKGGVGKSTVTANLGYSLALRGKQTLVIDCDFNIRNLDLIMGLEDRVVATLSEEALRRKRRLSATRAASISLCAQRRIPIFRYRRSRHSAR